MNPLNPLNPEIKEKIKSHALKFIPQQWISHSNCEIHTSDDSKQVMFSMPIHANAIEIIKANLLIFGDSFGVWLNRNHYKYGLSPYFRCRADPKLNTLIILVYRR